ncbi:LysE family translocator [Asanoa sp. WMMD1127]|uniref:LysE family translocator n=1 Tax=Asanoa sp. WMMD1127 TaxID=3016107 RepID=UPI002417199E|nr:LysE family translocator [Asanoa sp. WMMD1127]MDG4825922.1 LysE family translocator [Asanoa sp. WMMD1127]
MDVSLLLAFVVACALLSLAPGPDLLFVVANGVAGGRRAGVLAALGMSTGLAIHTVAAAFGLGALIQAAPQALTVVRLAGAVFLLYLAVATWRASRAAAEPTAVVPRRSLRRTYLMATLTNLANPKVILFYLAFVPQFLGTGPGAWPVTAQLMTLGLVFIVIGLAVDGTAGLLSGALAEKIAARPGFRRGMERLSAAVFAGLAARLVLDSR